MKTKALIRFAVTAKLIRVFVFAYAKSRFSHDAAHFIQCIKIKQPATADLYEPRCEKTSFSGFLTRTDINWAVQPHKMARGLKFRI